MRIGARASVSRRFEPAEIAAFHRLAETEGILPALESAHAVAEVIKRAPALSRRHVLLVNLSGRGDKDLESVIAWDAAQPPVPAAKAPRRNS